MNAPARKEPPRSPDVRIGSTTNALRPISAAERPLGAGTRQWVGLGAIAVAAVGADQLTKQVVARTLALGEEVEIVGPFSIHHVQNSGIAFGLFSQATSVVIVLTALAVALDARLLRPLRQRGTRSSRSRSASCSAAASRTSSTAIRLGHVTDFLDVRYWPAFNLADTFIVVGVAILFAALAGADRQSRRPRPLGNSPLSRP